MKKIMIFFLSIIIIVFLILISGIKDNCNEHKCGESCRCTGIKLGSKCIGSRVVSMIDCFNPYLLPKNK